MATKESGPRLIDVARAAGVSIATASRALAGTPGVRPAVAETVRRHADELGYVANVHARTLAGGHSKTVGLVVHEIGDPYFSEIASGLLRLADREGLSLQICHTGRDPEAELRQVRTLVAHRVAAIVVAGSGFDDPGIEAPVRRELDRFAEGGGRVAVIGRHHLGSDAVLPPNAEGGRAIAAHLLGLGHREIVVVAGSPVLTTVADRLAGVRAAVADAGLDPDAVPFLEGPFTRDGGRECARRILAEHPTATAVLALNDDMAIGCLSVFREEGVPVPGRMSVTGFDDVAVAMDLSPALTTYHLPMAQMGEDALRLALQDPAPEPRRHEVVGRLVTRDSSAVAPATLEPLG
ncbi:LacI family DNA-binding transcriptional regulator [Nocardioides zeae]|uniref:LacI family DNA-binding transcriptional regulator n=1 Tax=Nocardioides imazamoxiresistens TaxID=3231893 RepID=A0ABU3PS56_9ACTN|nr:LacI family DNA-binding transcriptional regulator [Nocardioides zeae]MDT9592058.1 LacI family DNA-binding transcriptional regulator [Nocardioides zeae]